MADFVLGRLKFVWKNTWATGTTYIKDDVVRHGGSLYVAILNHTAPASFTTNQNTYWQIMAKGQNFSGNFANATLYKVDDVVLYGSSLWICTTQHTSSSTLNESNFSLFLPGLEFEDTWSSGTAYQKGDIVTFGGYSYVCALQNTNQNPYNNTTYWEVLTTGFKMLGVWSSGTAYKTGEVVQYGGNTYVFKVNTTAGQLPTNGSYADLVVEGISLQGLYNSGTTYRIGQVVIYQNSSYRAIQDSTNKTPDVETTFWAVYNIGDASGVMSTRGDLITRSSVAPIRLPIGIKGTVLASNGVDLVFADTGNSSNIIYVSNMGNDTTGDGSDVFPFKTIKKASQQTNKNGIAVFDTIAGGTGGSTLGTFRSVSGTGGSGTGATFEVITDGSSTPIINVMQQGSGFAVGNTITILGTAVGNASNITFTVRAVTAGDLIRVKNGTYFETFPIILTAGVCLEGDSLRNTTVRPNTGSSTQIATVNNIGSNSASRTPGTYLNCISTATTGSGVSAKFTVVVDGSSAITVTCTHGGADYVVGNNLSIADNQLGSGGAAALTFTVATLKNNNVAEMFLVNDAVNVRQFTFLGMTTGARVFALDPSGSIATASPYIQNCTSVNTGTTGMYVDGLSQVSGNKSIIANDFSQINSDGIGVHVLRGGRSELVSVFNYYCDKAFFAESGGFIRGLNCSMAYGEKGAVADGTLASETPLSVLARGVQLYFTGNITNTSGGAAYTPVTGDTLVGGTSAATGTIRNFQANPKILFLDPVSGTFDQAETVTGTKLAGGATFSFVVGSIQGSAGTAQIGQKGTLFLLKSTNGALSTANSVKVGSNISFAGDATVYAVTAVTDESTANQFVTVRINPEKTTSIADGGAVSLTENYSNIRLTGHDFLDIGTGDFVTTNYPNEPTQPADQSDEITATNGGRVYWTSTDQRGDFRVGDLFRIEQATGVATLNADAFDLSGLTQLQLGSIGAQIGATINEFSTDGTLSGNSDIAVPTEQAVKTYVDTNSFSTGKAIAMAIVFG